MHQPVRQFEHRAEHGRGNSRMCQHAPGAWLRLFCHAPSNVVGQQQSPGGNRGQDVARQLRLRERKEDDRHRSPEQQKERQRVCDRCRGFLAQLLEGGGERCEAKGRPRHQRREQLPQPKRLRAQLGPEQPSSIVLGITWLTSPPD